MYTHQHAREQMPRLVERLNALVVKVGGNVTVVFDIADGLYDIQTVAPNGRITLLVAAQSPIQAWRCIHMLIDFTCQVHGLERQ